MCHSEVNKKLVATSGDLEGRKCICCGADDNTVHLYTQSGWQSRQEKGGEMEYGKTGGIRGLHPSPSHTELGGKNEGKEKVIVADKRAIQLRTPRT